jgi:DNA-binding XRE family transcriptional regulator
VQETAQGPRLPIRLETIMALSEERRAELERKGARVTDVQELLGLDDADMQIVELKVELAKEVRRRREAESMTQLELAGRMNVSQSRIPVIESGMSVGLESILHAFLAQGGNMVEFAEVVRRVPPSRSPQAGPEPSR